MFSKGKRERPCKARTRCSPCPTRAVRRRPAEGRQVGEGLNRHGRKCARQVVRRRHRQSSRSRPRPQTPSAREGRAGHRQPLCAAPQCPCRRSVAAAPAADRLAQMRRGALDAMRGSRSRLSRFAIARTLFRGGAACATGAAARSASLPSLVACRERRAAYEQARGENVIPTVV